MVTLLVLAGAGQIVLVLASLAIPFVLSWREDLARVKPLTRQVFWTYAGYIWVTNLCFGLVSVLAPHVLLDGSTLARIVCGYIAAYWGARLAIQFFYFDRIPGQKLAEAALTLLFVSLTGVYAAAAVT